MKEENANMDGQAPPPRRSPGDYRPDLRPMLILGGLLLAVIVGWILVSPLLLPSPR
jgi:hypothetical protein